MNRLALAATLAALTGPALAQQVPPIGSTPPAPPVAGPQTAPPPLVPATMPPALPAMSPSAPLSRRDASAVSMATRWRLRSCGTSMGASGVLQINHGNCEPTLVCAPFKLCVVTLEPGEMPTDLPKIGDPRWKTQTGFGMEEGRRVLQITFKPDDAGLDSNFVLATNQRTITLRLQSTQRAYMPFLKLGNPAFASQQEWRRLVASGATVTGAAASASGCEASPLTPPSAFEIDAPRAARAWEPVQVYTVPGKTCIEFPADIGSTDLPALVVLDGAGAQNITTWRMVGRRMEVDQLLSRAELVTGVGGSQVTVTIRRKDRR